MKEQIKLALWNKVKSTYQSGTSKHTNALLEEDFESFIDEVVKICAIPNVGKRIYLAFADHTCDSAYSTLEKANERLKQIKDQYPDMDGVYVISREVE